MPDVKTEYGVLPINQHVDICPHCHHAVLPLFVSATLNGKPDDRHTFMDVAYQCAKAGCERMFIGTYKRTASQGEKMIREFKFQKSVPINFKAPLIAEEIIDISPSFQKIFNEAATAESIGLGEIAGVGYRKALEFLIKDFCISQKPEEHEQIKSLLLGKVINTYVQDANLKACAKRAAWLGNDETHYVRKWECKDIEDLKILIQLTCSWVSSNVLTAKYMAEMA